MLQSAEWQVGVYCLLALSTNNVSHGHGLSSRVDSLGYISVDMCFAGEDRPEVKLSSLHSAVFTGKRGGTLPLRCLNNRHSANIWVASLQNQKKKNFFLRFQLKVFRIYSAFLTLQENSSVSFSASALTKKKVFLTLQPCLSLRQIKKLLQPSTSYEGQAMIILSKKKISFSDFWKSDIRIRSTLQPNWTIHLKLFPDLYAAYTFYYILSLLIQ